MKQQPGTSTAKVGGSNPKSRYRDVDGKPCSLIALCHREPEWAAHTITQLRALLEETLPYVRGVSGFGSMKLESKLRDALALGKERGK